MGEKTSEPGQTAVRVTLPATAQLTPAAARVLAAIVRDATRETPVLQLRVGHPDEPPEAVAS